MLMPSSRTRVFVSQEPCDMRKSFSGLVGLVRSRVQQDPLSGHLFLFLNRQRDYVKVLWWDTTGYCIWAKKLTKGRYRLPAASSIGLSDVYPLLEGYDPHTQAKRYRHIPE